MMQTDFFKIYLNLGIPIFNLLRWATIKPTYDCKISEIKQVGTHGILICEIVGIRQGEQASALVYRNRGYHSV